MTLLSKVTALGCPFHGLIEDGQLTLPNDATVPMPQPTGFEWSDFGKTLYQRMPWANANRTPEQLVEDVLKGRQWREDALVCGQGMQIHGKAVGGWIYAGPDGKPWRISAAELEGFYSGPGFTATLEASLFGRFGAEPETHTASVELADIGQSAPSIGVTPRGEVLDITPDGSKAIIMLWVPTDRSPFAVTALDKLSTGFLLLELSGTPGIDFAASLTVLHNRYATLGVGADSGAVPSTTVNYYRQNDITTTTVVVGLADCSGYREITTVPNAWPTTGAGEAISVTVQTGSREQSVTDRIVAVWFDEAGQPADVTLSYTRTNTISAPEITQEVSGQNVRREYHTGGSGGVCTYGPEEVLEDYTRRVSRDVVWTSDMTLTLTGPAGVVTLTLNKTEARAWELNWAYPEGETEDQSFVISVDSDFGSASADGGFFNWRNSPGDQGGAEGITVTQRLRVAEPVAASLFLEGGDFFFAGLGWMRESNNLISLYQRNLTSTAETWHLQAAVHPAGTNTATLSTAGTLPRYGSYNPATGQASRHNSQPVCWT